MHLHYGKSLNNIEQPSASTSNKQGQQRPNDPSQMLGVPTYVSPQVILEMQPLIHWTTVSYDHIFY